MKMGVSGMSSRQNELFNRINFWRKQNYEDKIQTSDLRKFSERTLEEFLRVSYIIFLTNKGEV